MVTTSKLQQKVRRWEVYIYIYMEWSGTWIIYKLLFFRDTLSLMSFLKNNIQTQTCQIYRAILNIISMRKRNALLGRLLAVWCLCILFNHCFSGKQHDACTREGTVQSLMNDSRMRGVGGTMNGITSWTVEELWRTLRESST